MSIIQPFELTADVFEIFLQMLQGCACCRVCALPVPGYIPEYHITNINQMWYPCTLRVFVIPAEEILELLLLQGDLRWVPLLPPSPTPEKREAATSSSTGPASKTAATAKTKKKGTSVDGEQGSDVAGGGTAGRVPTRVSSQGEKVAGRVMMKVSSFLGLALKTWRRRTISAPPGMRSSLPSQPASRRSAGTYDCVLSGASKCCADFLFFILSLTFPFPRSGQAVATGFVLSPSPLVLVLRIATACPLFGEFRHPSLIQALSELSPNRSRHIFFFVFVCGNGVNPQGG